MVQQSNGIVEDDIDRIPTFVFFTPALGRTVVADGLQDGAISYRFRPRDGDAGVAAVERESARAAPPDTSFRNVFAGQIFAVSQPSVSLPALALVALGALVVANLAAALPGLVAARTPTARLLRSE